MRPLPSDTCEDAAQRSCSYASSSGATRAANELLRARASRCMHAHRSMQVHQSETGLAANARCQPAALSRGVSSAPISEQGRSLPPDPPARLRAAAAPAVLLGRLLDGIALAREACLINDLPAAWPPSSAAA